MAKFIPMINCGYNAGSTPMYWNANPHFFDTEEECDNWIEENMDNFTPNESGGGIYPDELNEEGISFYKEHFSITD